MRHGRAPARRRPRRRRRAGRGRSRAGPSAGRPAPGRASRSTASSSSSSSRGGELGLELRDRVEERAAGRRRPTARSRGSWTSTPRRPISSARAPERRLAVAEVRAEPDVRRRVTAAARPSTAANSTSIPAGPHVRLADAHPHRTRAREPSTSASATAVGERLEQRDGARPRPRALPRRPGGSRPRSRSGRAAALAPPRARRRTGTAARRALLLEHAVVAEQLQAVQLDVIATSPPARPPQRLDVRADVVDAEDRRAALVRGDRGADRRPSVRADAPRSPSRRPSVLLRENPTSTGRPRAASSGEPPHELEVLRHGLPEADARVEADELLADPGGDREREPLLEEGLHLGRRRRRTAGRACIVRGSPCMCIRQSRRPRPPPRRPAPGRLAAPSRR